jgi:hypothetical protein
MESIFTNAGGQQKLLKTASIDQLPVSLISQNPHEPGSLEIPDFPTTRVTKHTDDVLLLDREFASSQFFCSDAGFLRAAGKHEVFVLPHDGEKILIPSPHLFEKSMLVRIVGKLSQTLIF